MSREPFTASSEHGAIHGEFRSLAEAETWARRQVKAHERLRGYAISVHIWQEDSGRHVGTVRMDGLGRVWTDMT